VSEQSLEDLQRKACSDPCFTDSEKDLIREMIRIYRGWQFVAKVGKGVAVSLGLIAGIIVSWDSIGEAIKSWIN